LADDTNRPQFAEALKACRAYGATLIIAKLDRVSRDAHFLLGLQKAGVRFVATDMPEANEMIVGIMAVIAEGERKMISPQNQGGVDGREGPRHEGGWLPERAQRDRVGALRPILEHVRGAALALEID
jgi:DNA invertase Pin-like site-specific DNA recombinase